MTSVGRKCLRANVDLPEPEVPTRTTSASSGNRASMGCAFSVRLRGAEERDLRGRTQLGIFVPDGVVLHVVAEALALARAPRAELFACPFKTMIGVAHAAGR